jgi:Kef-type K+ transport system membrane component KefB
VILTVGSIGWTVGSWLQARPWLRMRRDWLITLGCISVALGVGLVGLIAFLPTLPYVLVSAAWIFSGLGMGLATSSTSLAVMSLSDPTEQGRNASSLNVADALGSGIFVGIAGTIFAGLHSSGNLALTFGLVQLSMAVVGLLAVLTSRRIGIVRNEFTAKSGS